MNIILRCFAVTCLLLFSLSALGDNNRRSQAFVMFNAGTLNVGIVQLQFNDGSFEPTSIIEERSLGTLGRADLKTSARVIDARQPPLNTDERCPDGFPFLFVITKDVIVLTFHDLSQLVGDAETAVCVEGEFPGGAQGIRGEGHWTSGTHRFANVTGGKFHLRSSATPQSTNGQFYSTVGSLSGRIERR